MILFKLFMNKGNNNDNSLKKNFTKKSQSYLKFYTRKKTNGANCIPLILAAFFGFFETTKLYLKQIQIKIH